MRSCLLLLALAAAPSAQADPALPELVKLQQAAPRAHPRLNLPPEHSVGPTIPGLTGGQGAIPQGLAYWEQQNWLLISCDFRQADHPSVVVAIDATTGTMMRCLTLVEEGGQAHTGHVGGLAVSDKYLWVGSGHLYRAPLAAIAAAQPVAHLTLRRQFPAACTASYVAFHDRRVWVGEFVSQADGIRGAPAHVLKDRNGIRKYAWVAGYAVDANEDGAGEGELPTPVAILSVRQKVQGLAFLGDSILLSTSYGRRNDSTLAAYANPLQEQPHGTAQVMGVKVPVWFLDGRNRQWEIDDFPPLSEGVTPFGPRFGVICESGAEAYLKGGRGPLDSVIFLTPPTGT